MAIKIGNTNINKAYLGNIKIKKMYLGSIVIFNSDSDSPNKMTIETLQLT
jgi:hypothetical protein